MYFVCFRWRLSRLDPGDTDGRPIPRGRPPSLRAPCILREQRGHARPRSPAARRQRADARRGIAPDERQRCSSGQRRRPASRVPSSRAGSGQRPRVSRPPHAALAECPRPTATRRSGPAPHAPRLLWTRFPRRTSISRPADAPNGQVLFRWPRSKPTVSRRRSAPNPQRELRPHALTSPLRQRPGSARGIRRRAFAWGAAIPAASSRAPLGDPCCSARAESPCSWLSR